MKWISDRYGRPIIYVTENGTSLKGENDKTKDEIMQDDFRVKYFQDYVNAMAEAYTFDDVDVRGYMAWSLLESVMSRPFMCSHVLTSFLQQLRVGRGLRDSLRCYLCRLRRRPEALPQEERKGNQPDLQPPYRAMNRLVDRRSRAIVAPVCCLSYHGVVPMESCRYRACSPLLRFR